MTQAQLFLLCRSGETWLALPAETIEAVALVQDITPVPHAPAAILGIAAIRSRLLTLIDVATVAAGVPRAGEGPAMMVITSVDGHGYGLCIDAVDDVVALPTLQKTPGTLSPAWRSIARHMADQFGRTMLIVEPADVVAAAQHAVDRAA